MPTLIAHEDSKQITKEKTVDANSKTKLRLEAIDVNGENDSLVLSFNEIDQQFEITKENLTRLIDGGSNKSVQRNEQYSSGVRDTVKSQ